MDIQKKVEQQYELVKKYNALNVETELYTGQLVELLEEFENGQRNTIHLVNEMKKVIDRLYVREYEKDTLVRLIKSL